MNTASPSIRKKAELFGLICGVAGGVFATTNQSNSMVLWIVAASALAGAMGNFLADAGDDPGLRPRAGIRAGVIASLVAGATAVACFTLKVGGFAIVKIIPALLAIPPGVFFGLLGSLIVSMLQNPAVRPVGQWEPKEKTRPTALLIAILVGSFIGYLSPFIATMMPERRAPVVELSPLPRLQPPPSPTPEPRPITPPSPPWKYQPPANFTDAHPSQLRVQKEVSLGHFDRPLRSAFSNDGQRLAFVRSDSEIIVLDLDEPETASILSVPEVPGRLSFSPDGKRLFCATNRGGIFVLNKERAIRLPLPSSIPDGPIAWLDEACVLIGSQSLDLNTLKLSSAPSASEKVTASHPNIRLRSSRRIQSIQDGSMNTESHFALSDVKRDYSLTAPIAGAVPFFSPDGTKLLYIRDDELRAVYFELQPSREAKFVATMPTAPPADLEDGINSQRVVALLCPAIINPLNNKPVGADLSRVKALLGVESWVGTSAVFWVKDDYGIKVENGDVVGYLAKFENGKLVPFSAFTDWWALARDVKSADAPERVAPTKPKSEPLPPLPARETKDLIISEKLANQLRNFLREHHAKSSRGDIDGLVADYAERVEHLKGDVVDRETIRADEIKSHRPGSTLSELVQGEIQLTQTSESVVRAIYTIRFEQTLASGAWARGFSDLDIAIDVSGNFPRIVGQRAKNHDTQKGP